MDLVLKTLYDKNISYYKNIFTQILHCSDVYLRELIIFITLSEFLAKSYYPPFEIKSYITKLKNNNLLSKLVISDDPETQILFKENILTYFNIKSKCTYIEEITINIVYGVNMKRLSISNLTKLDDLKNILFNNFNLVPSLQTISFSNQILKNNLSVGEYFINNSDTLYLFSNQSA
jgi:hypothetical protein